MSPIVLRDLVFIACVHSGLLAGIDVDLVVVRFPAWRRVGSRAWAAYSRKADLRNGMFLYPPLAIGHALLMILVVIGLRGGSRNALLTAAFAAGLAIAGLLLTVGAAPFMLSLKRIGDDPVALDRAFAGFARWSRLRAAAQVLAFIATLCLLADPSP